MKHLTSFGIVSLFAGLLLSCSPPDAVQNQSRAEDYFFDPYDLTLLYTYSQDNASSNDTATYSVTKPAYTNGSFSSLVRADSLSSGNDTLYLFKNEIASDGSMMCVLANSQKDQGIIALKGILDLDATWFADSAQNIKATVVGKYSDYYLPGREIHYDDVVAVKYTDKTAASETYKVRYFARRFGLILERTIVSTNSEIINLELLYCQGSFSGINSDPNHDHWYDRNGKFVANMKPIKLK